MDTNTIVQLPLDKVIQLCSDHGPSGYDVLSLIATIVLGVLSIALAFLVFHLSRRFETKAETALDKVNTLAIEIKQMVQSGLVDQSKMSNKMLDSILSGNYGSPPPVRSEAIEQEEKQTLDKISTLVDAKLSSIKTVDRAEIDTLKREIRAISEAHATPDKHIISDKLFRRVSKFKQFPAFLVLVDAIVKKEYTSLAQVEDNRTTECIPVGMDEGITSLIREEILQGTPDDFRVNNKYAAELKDLLDANADVTQELKKFYATRGIDKIEGVGKKEIAISSKMIF